MKKLLFILCITCYLLVSCSSNDDEANDSSNGDNSTLVKKITSTDGEFNEFVYDGNKLMRVIYQNGSYSEFTYTGDLISSMFEYKANNKPGAYAESYEHSNGKLVGLKVYYNSELVESYNYTYLDGNSVKETDLIDDKVNRKLYFDSNQNIIKQEYFWNNKIEETTVWTYDNKNNPFKNVIGLNFAMRSIDAYIDSKNNIISFVQSGDENGKSTFEYQYNDQNFPTLATIFNTIDNSETLYTFQY